MEEEKRCKQVGSLQGGKWDKMHESSRRVYAPDGLAPTQNTSQGGGHETKIIEPIIWDGFNGRVKADNTTVGTITTNVGKDLKRNGQGVIERVANDEQNNYIRTDGTVGTLTTDGSSPKHNNRIIEPTGKIEEYRIRRLTEKECGRLMGVKDEDIEKIAKHQSASGQYKLYGNSIVVQVLMAIFNEMI